MSDSSLARGLLRQETRRLAPLALAARLDGVRFATRVASRITGPKGNRLDKSSFNVALASYARAVAASPATVEARHQKMGLSRYGESHRICLIPTVVDRQRQQRDPETEWGVGIDHLEVTGKGLNAAWWMAGVTITGHFAIKHMQRLRHENAKAALLAGAQALEIALLFRDCQILAGATSEIWEVIVPMQGGTAYGGTEAVGCSDIDATTGVGLSANRPKPLPTAKDGLHLVASLRTFLDSDSQKERQEKAAGYVAAWLERNRDKIGDHPKDRHSHDIWAASQARLDLLTSFMPIARQVQESHSRWRRAYEQAQQQPGGHAPQPATAPAKQKTPGWAAKPAITTNRRLGETLSRRRHATG